MKAASCCRHHDVTVIFTAEIFHAAANVLTAVGTSSCVPDFLLLLAVPSFADSLLLLTSLLSPVYPPTAGGLAVAGGSAVSGVLLYLALMLLLTSLQC